MYHLKNKSISHFHSFLSTLRRFASSWKITYSEGEAGEGMAWLPERVYTQGCSHGLRLQLGSLFSTDIFFSRLRASLLSRSPTSRLARTTIIYFDSIFLLLFLSFAFYFCRRSCVCVYVCPSAPSLSAFIISAMFRLCLSIKINLFLF